MKRLLFMMCMLISLSSYANRNPPVDARRDGDKLMRVMDRDRQKTNQSPKNNQSGNSKEKTTKPAVASKSADKSTPNELNEKFNAGLNVWDAVANASHTTDNGFDAFNQNSSEIIVDGKNAKGNSSGLSNGIPPQNVKISTPLTQERIKQLNTRMETITKAMNMALKRQANLKEQYRIQCNAIEKKLIEKHYQPTVAKELVKEYIMRRDRGEPTSPNANALINEIDMALNTYKERKNNDKELEKLNSALKAVQTECKGLCGNTNP